MVEYKIDDLKKKINEVIDGWFAQIDGQIVDVNIGFTKAIEEIKPERTDGKRAVRTKSTGDRVYLVDDIAKTKAWVTGVAPKTGPDTLKELGFEMSDVIEVEDSSLIGYQVQPTIYKAD